MLEHADSDAARPCSYIQRSYIRFSALFAEKKENDFSKASLRRFSDGCCDAFLRVKTAMRSRE